MKLVVALAVFICSTSVMSAPLADDALVEIMQIVKTIVKYLDHCPEKCDEICDWPVGSRNCLEVTKASAEELPLNATIHDRLMTVTTVWRGCVEDKLCKNDNGGDVDLLHCVFDIYQRCNICIKQHCILREVEPPSVESIVLGETVDGSQYSREESGDDIPVSEDGDLDKEPEVDDVNNKDDFDNVDHDHDRNHHHDPYSETEREDVGHTEDNKEISDEGNDEVARDPHESNKEIKPFPRHGHEGKDSASDVDDVKNRLIPQSVIDKLLHHNLVQVQDGSKDETYLSEEGNVVGGDGYSDNQTKLEAGDSSEFDHERNGDHYNHRYQLEGLDKITSDVDGDNLVAIDFDQLDINGGEIDFEQIILESSEDGST